MKLDCLDLWNKLIFAALVAGLPLTFATKSLSRSFVPRNAQISPHKTAKTNSAAPASSKDLPVPFRAGEVLKYQVSWSVFATAASVELSVPERRDLYGWRTWHFRASAHTVSPVRTLFAIDDQFDSYTDATTLESRQYETHLNEMGRQVDQRWRFIQEGQARRGPGAAVIVLPGTRDPLGALYSLRAVDWQHTPEVRAPVYEGHDLYELRAKMEASGEAVEVPAGKFSAARIAIHVFQHQNEVSGINFAMWLASDAPRTPVLMTADLPFGSLRIEMVSAVPR
jgi:hypothetical protein